MEAGYALEDRLVSYFDQHPDLGEFDGDGVGFGYLDLYMYATNPDNLVAQILPLVRETHLPDGSHILTHVTETGADEKRYEL